MKQRPIRELYWGLIENSDYPQRDGKRITKLYRDLGFNIAHTSQDASRWAACVQAGLVRITTKTCHARYIGDFGVHERPGRYKKYRFADSIWYPRRPKVLMPTQEQLSHWREEQEIKLADGYVHSYVLARQVDLNDLSDEDLLEECTTTRNAGDFARATAAFELGMRKFPDKLDSYGHATFRKELLRMLGALRAWKDVRALVSNPEEWIVHPWHEIILGRAYAAAGEISEANYWWARALKRNEPEAQKWFDQQIGQ